MDELGHVLREARETKGLTLAQVEEQTRINRRFLEALENGDYQALPTPVHVRGFLRNYARFLGLDPQPLLERYELVKEHVVETAVSPTPSDLLPQKPLPLRDDQPFFDPVNYEVADGQQRDPQSVLRLFIILALIATLVLVASRAFSLFSSEDNTSALTDGINDVLQNLTNGDAVDQATPDGAEEVDPLAPTEDAILNTSRNDFGAANPTPTPTRPPLPATMDTINLRLDITERTWMEVTVDGDVRFSGIAKRGDVYEWTAESEVTLLTGNAFGIVATINEVELGRLGGFQEAREEVWRTTE
ncbi:MAG: helix-turn-helix domain-containing protein [Ardenticatenaceae bacterium]|nr:helix-turn-helix domain-containing protein [Anaerolineales bacterium]MCB8922804.1 helix-turn-helix domain-containing protein [Ardenticatenaceae bacterium]MCB8991937.1 helix-turn-helix domain-containing protein [Ardenticatenaceae bacterium]MCB9004747.1 helix-turn-helix domain-containing protein [Ardenticatenaceae bacterium]